MNPTTQSGVHPDADSLNAFVEQVSPAAERQEILAHLALCGSCREVVFLAQQAAGAEADARVVVASSEQSRSWRRWFAPGPSVARTPFPVLQPSKNENRSI